MKRWIDPRVIFVDNLISHVDAEMSNSTYESLSEYNSDEAKAWNDIYFYYQYEKKMPKTFPPISNKVSFRIATSISR